MNIFVDSYYFQHLNPISALDWHPVSNLLLSSSTDRGVIVWEENKEIRGLKPQLAIVKETKANIDAAWNVKGTKFCVGAASGHVFIGNFSAANNFWIGQALGKYLIINLIRWKEASPQIKCSQCKIRSIVKSCLRFRINRWNMPNYFLLCQRNR